MITRRKSKGNMIFLVSLVIGIILIVALLGIGFNYLLFMRAQSQYKADSLALSLATSLNMNDRIGEINQLQEASRELIFVSRQHSSEGYQQKNAELSSLCDRLLDDARSGHILVEGERQNQILATTIEIQNSVLEYNRERKKDSIFSCMGLKIFAPEILRVDIGRIAKVNSNVRVLDGLPELTAIDRFNLYFDKTSKLYRSDINAKLPESDSDLDFNFSSLPPAIGLVGSAARNTNEHVFVRYATIFADGKNTRELPKQIPSALQVYFAMDSIVPWDQSTKIPISIVATGTTFGASADSQ
jgi:hypothetical protein